MFVAVKRATLLYPSGPSHHLLILLNDPFGSAQQVLMVPACTCRPKALDSTCIVRPGDHEFIQHESYIAYRHCRIEPASRLLNGVRTREFVDKGLLREDVFGRVLVGLKKSRFTAPYAVSFIEDVERAASKAAKGS